MKRIILVILIMTLVNLSYGQKKKSTVSNKMKTVVKTFYTHMDSVSYVLGMLYGKNLQKLGTESINYLKFNEGFKTAVENKSTLMISDEQAQKLASSYFESKKEAMYAQIKEKNTAFLIQNSKKPNVKITASGLQYEVLREGNGKTPNDTTSVQTHYIGSLIDGTEFDNSYKRNEPLEIKPTQVIKGWNEGLKLMNEGAKYRFVIPYNLAYGERGQAQIPPFSTLIFEVDLLKVQ